MKRIHVDADYIVREYRSGKTVREIARKLGVRTRQVIYRALYESGIRPSRRITIDESRLVRLYCAGESVAKLAGQFGISRDVIHSRLLSKGIVLRGRSAAEFLKWSQMSGERRAAQVKAAHEAVRGKPISQEHRIRIAKTRERLGIGSSALERRIAQALSSRGLETVPQQAIGPYNCDLAAFPVAVEVFGGGWHWHGRHIRRSPERIRYILNAGWHLLMLRISKVEPFTDATADYVIAYVERARSNPASPREYRVIRRAGELVAAGRLDDNKFSIEPAFTNRRDPRTGRYQSVPR